MACGSLPLPATPSARGRCTARPSRAEARRLWHDGTHVARRWARLQRADLLESYVFPIVIEQFWTVKPRRAPAFGPARHWHFAGGALTPPLTKGMLTPPWNPSIRFPALTGGA